MRKKWKKRKIKIPKKSKFRQLEDLYFAPKYLCSKFREDPLRTVGGDRFLRFPSTDRRQTDVRQNFSPITTASLVLETSEAKNGRNNTQMNRVRVPY